MSCRRISIFLISIVYSILCSVAGYAESEPVLTLSDGSTWVRSVDTENEETESETVLNIFKEYGGGVKHYWNPEVVTDLEVLRSIVPDTYRAIPGDVFTVEIEYSSQRNDQITQRRMQYSARVEDDGDINLPNIGAFNIDAMTYKTLRETLIETYQDLMFPDYINVTFSMPAQFIVNVQGAVTKPGVILANSMMHIIDSIGLSGGFTEHADYRAIRIQHADGTVDIVDIVDYVLTGNGSAEMRLSEGDRVYVPRSAKQVEISGPVIYPGAYELSAAENLPELVAFAGGFTLDADRTGFELIRYKPDGTKQIERISASAATDDSIMNMELRNGDSIRFDSAARNSPFITVEGAIFGAEYTEAMPIPTESQLITLPYYDGIDLKTVLSQGGGPTPYAEGNELLVFRKGAAASGDSSSLNILTLGMQDVLSGETLVQLNPGDRVFVPMDKRVVVINGQVNDPGAVEYEYNRDIRYYLLMAGGVTELGDSDRIYLTDENGTRKRRVELNYVPEPAEFFFVDKRLGRNVYENTYDYALPAILTTLNVTTAVIGLVTTIINLAQQD